MGFIWSFSYESALAFKPFVSCQGPEMIAGQLLG
jgi:hypothetical protein